MFEHFVLVRHKGGKLKGILRFIATGFEFGKLPGAPGTYGTVIGAGLYILVSGLPAISYVLFTIAFVFLSVWIVAQILPDYETEDPQEIVIDEIAGLFVAMLFHPFTWLNLGLAFVLFRLFDIIKPPPIRQIERKVKGAWGIVLDDVVAGLFACIVIWVIRLFIS